MRQASQQRHGRHPERLARGPCQRCAADAGPRWTANIRATHSTRWSCSRTARERLFCELPAALDKDEREFLRSLVRTEPKWSTTGHRTP